MQTQSILQFIIIFLFTCVLSACQKQVVSEKTSASATSNTAVEERETTPQISNKTVKTPVTILAIGDSLTEGLGLPAEHAYPAQLEQALKELGYVNAKVVNSGLSGETSTGLVNRLDWALKTKPHITILIIGANDAMRGIDVVTVEKNLRTAIERLQREGNVVVLGGMQIYDNLGSDYVKKFSAVYPKLAREYDVAFIPFFLEGVAGVAQYNQPDAIHPTKEGYTKIVKENILPKLLPKIESFTSQSD